jgi:RHS repeat-associated protein
VQVAYDSHIPLESARPPAPGSAAGLDHTTWLLQTARQKYTGYERDAESGLDYAHARYYANGQGRFTSTDPLQSSGATPDPQSWNRYSYALNSPVKFTDPSGMEVPKGPSDSRWMAGFRGGAPGEMEVFEGTQYTNGTIGLNEADLAEMEPAAAQLQQQTATSQVVDVRDDQKINDAVDTISLNSSPLNKGEAPVLTNVYAVVGNTYQLNNGTLIDAYGNVATGITATVRPVAFIPVDQNGNVIKRGNEVCLGEIVKTVTGQRPTTSEPTQAPQNGVFRDLQTTGPGVPLTTLNQTVVVSQGKIGFKTGPNEITKDAAAGRIEIKLGPTVKIKS